MIQAIADWDLGGVLAKLAGAGLISWGAVAAFVKWALPAKLREEVNNAIDARFKQLEQQMNGKADADDVREMKSELREMRKQVTTASENIAHILGLLGAEQRRRPL